MIALNGRLPLSHLGAAQHMDCAARLRVFVGHGTYNPVVPIAQARKSARQLRTAGFDLRFASYPTTQRLHDDMLRDVNRWIMEAVNEAEGLPMGTS
jgi:phospholipase/carboxylesterase